MPKHRPALSALLAATLVGGCLGGAPGAVRPKASATPKPGAVRPAGSTAPTAADLAPPAPLEGRLAGLVRAPGQLISDRGGAILSNNGGSLISDQGGSVVSNNGGNLISDQGGSVVSNNGGNLTAGGEADLISKSKIELISKSKIELISKSKLVEQPYANAVVRLYRASGAAVTGPDGQALTATTDAQGRYAFTAELPAVPLLVAVELPDGKGTLRALAMPDAGNRRLVDADYVSTLATGYVAEKYLKDLADPEAALAKLPREVELETRLKTAEALVAGAEAGKVTPPVTLTGGTVVAAVDALRAADGTIDAQLDKVRDILIAAGQTDLGNGLPATEVVLSIATQIARAPDGTLYLYCDGDYRVWRLGADGKLVNVLGTAGRSDLDYGEDLVDGLPGTQLELGEIRSIAVDAAGRLLVSESNGIHEDDEEARKDPDFGFTYMLDGAGRIKIRWRVEAGDTRLPRVVAPGPADEVDVLTVRRRAPDGPAEHWAIAPDGKRRLVRTFTAEQGEIVLRADQHGRDARGRFYLGAWSREGSRAQQSRVWRYDPADGSFTTLADREAEGLEGLTVATDGTIVALGRDRTLAVRPPDGEARTVLASLPAEYGIDLNAVARDPDGTLHLVLDRGVIPTGYAENRHRLYDQDDGLLGRIRGGAFAIEAGTVGATAGQAGTIALNSPSGLAVGPDGRLFVADSGSNRILEVGTDDLARTVVGDGVAGGTGDGGPGPKGRVAAPECLRCDGAGRLYWREAYGRRIRTLAPDGTLGTRFVSQGSSVVDLAAAPDGTLYFLESVRKDRALRTMLRALAPGSDVPRDLGPADEMAALAVAPDGTIYMAGGIWLDDGDEEDGWLRRWTPAGGVEEIDRGGSYNVFESTMAIDAQGRVILAYDSDEVIYRVDPRTLETVDLAGDDGRVFKGGSSDDSMVSPSNPAFDRAGNLLFVEEDKRQIRRIPAAQLY